MKNTNILWEKCGCFNTVICGTVNSTMGPVFNGSHVTYEAGYTQCLLPSAKTLLLQSELFLLFQDKVFIYCICYKNPEAFSCPRKFLDKRHTQ